MLNGFHLCSFQKWEETKVLKVRDVITFWEEREDKYWEGESGLLRFPTLFDLAGGYIHACFITIHWASRLMFCALYWLCVIFRLLRVYLKQKRKKKKGCEELGTLTYCQCECTQEETSYNILEKLKLWKLGNPANSPPSFASGLGTPVHAPPWELFKKP